MFSKADAERIVRQNANREREEYLQEEFDKVDSEALHKMPDKELAKWQYHHTDGEERAESILAKYEWQRRLVTEQVKATNHAALYSVLCTFLAFILGLSVPWVNKLIDVYAEKISHREPQNNPNAQRNEGLQKGVANPKGQIPVTGEVVPPANKP
jgi:hypothetical protein